MILQSLLYLLASLTVFLILTEVITIDISYGEKTVIDFNFMLFGIRFTESEKANRKGRKKRFRPDFYTVTNLIKHLLHNSEVIVHRIAVLYPPKTPSDDAIKIGVFTSALSALAAYADAEAKNFALGNITFQHSANNNHKIMFDVSFRLYLLSFLIMSAKLYFGKIKKRLNGYG